jgi:steroid 5-alpha reductase family enzyme
MPFLHILPIAGLTIFCLMAILWLVSLQLNNAGIVDIFWGVGFIAVAWLVFSIAPQGYLPRKTLTCSMTTLWGLRLALHIGRRNWGKPEDFRYAAWRTTHGSRWWWLSFFQVFLLQGFLMWIVSIPIIAAQTSGFPAILTPLDMLGVSLWASGLIVESLADSQLERFKHNPANKGMLLTAGIWKYSRHPNYFGETVLWWGIYVVALAAGAWWTIVSPILMTWLLVRVSGVTMLERTMKLKPGYEEYTRKTSAFFPWFPRS